MFAWFRRFACLHREFTPWHPVKRVLVGQFGYTVDDVQQRECTACGHVQRREIERA